MSLNGFVFGQHIGDIVANYFRFKTARVEPEIIPRGFSTRYLSKRDYLTILFGILSWLGVIFAAIFAENQKELALACVFAPIGALTRWYLSFYNGEKPHFPIGTFIANIFGTAVLALLSLVQSGIQVFSIACHVVQALADGYCSCLTTISTFVVRALTVLIE
jgi:CrcB protein